MPSGEHPPLQVLSSLALLRGGNIVCISALLEIRLRIAILQRLFRAVGVEHVQNTARVILHLLLWFDLLTLVLSLQLQIIILTATTLQCDRRSFHRGLFSCRKIGLILHLYLFLTSAL